MPPGDITAVVRPGYGNLGQSRPSALPDTGQFAAGAGDGIRPCTQLDSVILPGIRNLAPADRGRGHGHGQPETPAPGRMQRIHPQGDVADYTVPCPLHPATGQEYDAINCTKRRVLRRSTSTTLTPAAAYPGQSCCCSWRWPRNLAGNPDSPQAVVFLTSIIDIIVDE